MSYYESLVYLPSLVVGRIFSYLPWRDKLAVTYALPCWRPHLLSSDSWAWFDTNYEMVITRQRLKQLHLEACKCIKDFGQYIQQSTIALNYLDFTDMGLELLQHTAEHCVNMKSFRMYHPACFTLSWKTDLDTYITSLQTITSKCSSLHTLGLYTMDYVPVNRTKGISELFDPMVERGVAANITELEFSHAYGFGRPIRGLQHFDALTKLHCPVQVLNTDILLELVAKSLVQLSVINDGSTLNEEFSEGLSLDWQHIAERKPNLHVHYIVQSRTLRTSDLTENPLVRTFVLDSLCNGVGKDLIEQIASHYGGTLETFAHLASEWNYLPYEDLTLVPMMYFELVDGCSRLHTIMSALPMPSLAIACAAGYGCIQHLWVDKEQVSYEDDEGFYVVPSQQFNRWVYEVSKSEEDLLPAISKVMHCDWQPLSSDELAEKTKLLLTL